MYNNLIVYPSWYVCTLTKRNMSMSLDSLEQTIFHFSYWIVTCTFSMHNVRFAVDYNYDTILNSPLNNFYLRLRANNFRQIISVIIMIIINIFYPKSVIYNCMFAADDLK